MSLTEVARLLGRHRNTISSWVGKGCPVAAQADRDTGREWLIDLGSVLEWYAAEAAGRVRSAERKRTAALEARLASLEGAAPDACSYDEARRRRAVARARLDELETAHAEGQSIDFELCTELLKSLLSMVRDRLLALPTAVSPLLVGLRTPEIAAALDERVRDALTEIADAGAAAKQVANRTKAHQEPTLRRRRDR